MLSGILERITRVVQPEPIAQPASPVENLDPENYTLEEARQIFPNLPELNSFLGVCEDGYPMLIDLNQSGNGAILIISSDRQGRTDLVQMMAESSLRSNPSSQFKFSVVFSDLQPWQDFLENREHNSHLMAKMSADSPKATDWILQLALLAEDRSFGRRLGASILLILDEAEFLQNADNNVRSNFVWLCQYGPQFGVRPVISLSAEAALEMPEIIQHIRTRIYGRMPNQASFHLSSFSGLNTEEFETDQQYVVRSQNNWIHFWTPWMDR